MDTLPWLLLISLAPAMVSAKNDLDDFSNNLISDLGPLLTLFGDRMTVQFLSESTSWWDYIIFAMGPIGIITAIVSAIRVTGSPALRAFIGRAQEGDGVVEAELCTSTSRDVCEVFNNGGITRVLGRPKILEIIHVPGQRLESFRDYLERAQEKREAGFEWKQVKRSNEDYQFPPSPNVSLNAAIRQIPVWASFTIAIVAIILQAGVLAFAIVSTSRLQGFQNQDVGPQDNASLFSTDRAVILFTAGTCILCVGMFSCAALIGQSTFEKKYSRERNRIKRRQARMFWIQPGNQIVGDQTYDAFAYSEATSRQINHYTFSTKNTKETNLAAHLVTSVSAAMALGGFILQFIGLRGLNPYISLAQLALTLVMSVVRGCLRIRNISSKDNQLRRIPDLVVGQELDWLSLHVAGLPGSNTWSKRVLPNPRSWDLTSRGNVTDTSRSSLTDSQWEPRSKSGFIQQALQHRIYLSQLTGNTGERTSHSPRNIQIWDDERLMPVARVKSRVLAKAIEGAARVLISKNHKTSKSLNFEVASRWNPSNPDSGLHVTETLSISIRNPHYRLATYTCVDSSSIEAILGLWIWSFLTRCHPVISVGNSQHAQSTLKVSLNRIIMFDEADLGESFMEWGLWESGTHSSLFNLGLLNIKDVGTLRQPTALRRTGGGDPVKIPAYHLAPKLSLGRWNPDDEDAGHLMTECFYGWSKFCCPQITPLQGKKELGFSYRQLDRSHLSDSSQLRKILVDESAIEFFTISISALANDSSVHIGPVVPKVSYEGSIFTRRRILLSNNVVSELVSVFTENNLGSEQDALACIIPALRPKLLESYCRPCFLALMMKIIDEPSVFDDTYLMDLLRWTWQNFLRMSTRSSSSAALNIGLLVESVILYLEFNRQSLSRTGAPAQHDLERFKDAIESVRQFDQQYNYLEVIAGRYLYVGREIGKSKGIDTVRFDEVEIAVSIQLGTNGESDAADDIPISIETAIERNWHAQALYMLTQNDFPLVIPDDAVHRAASVGWGEVAVALARRNADPDYELRGISALAILIEQGDYLWGRALLDLGATPDHDPYSQARLQDGTERPTEWRPICRAAAWGDMEMMKVLIDTGMVKDLQQPFMIAVQAAQVETVQFLLQQKGLDPARRVEVSLRSLECKTHNNDHEILDFKGWTAIELAADMGHDTVVDVLLDDPRIIDQREAVSRALGTSSTRFTTKESRSWVWDEKE